MPHDFNFKHEQVQFVVLPDYETMAKFPKGLRDAIGRENIIFADVFKYFEKLWSTHIIEYLLQPAGARVVIFPNCLSGPAELRELYGFNRLQAG